MEKRSRLGRGLNSLLSSGLADAEATIAARPVTDGLSESTGRHPPAYEMFHVEHFRILRNENQPRREFNEATLKTLADSIAAAGIIQPILVREIGEQSGQYEVIAGERRLRAAKLAGLEKIPVIVRPVDTFERSQIALIENIHREDLNPIDRALAYRSLLINTGLTQQDLAVKLGEERSNIANHMRLLDLEESVKKAISDGKISLGHAKLLAGVDNPAEQAKLTQLVITEAMPVRKLEELLKAPQNPAKKPGKVPSAHIIGLERQLSRDLQMRAEVRQSPKGGKGRLVIHYGSLDQFDELMNRLGIKMDD